MSQQLQDIHDIGQVMIRYATSVDQRDMERYRSCFTDDVEVTGFSAGAVNGLDTYANWVSGALANFAATHHQITNQEVTVDGDSAHLRSYVQATHVMAADTDSLMILWAIYDDKLIRTEAGWKITHHRLERLINSRKIHAPAL